MRLTKQTRKIARSATVRGAIVFNAFSPDSRPALTKGGRAWGASSMLLKKVHICARSIGVEFGNRMRPLILYMLQSPPRVFAAPRLQQGCTRLQGMSNPYFGIGRYVRLLDSPSRIWLNRSCGTGSREEGVV